LAPKIAIPKIDININKNNVDIKLKGGLVTKIAGIFTPYLKDTLLPTII